jgi:putative Mg2+ transporter-C (MgtC) family protein
MDAWWEAIWNTLRGEFADLPSTAEVTRIVVRLLVAAALGGVLGFEREQKGKSAGMRTHMLVSLGAALFVLIPQQIGVSDADLTRVLQGVIAGIGFLGAGTIIKRAAEEDVQGLTTAAGIWLTAAIGIAAGLGRESSAVLSTLLALAILTLGPRIHTWFGGREDEPAKASEAPPESK